MNTHGLEPMEECEYEKMLELRETLELKDTVIPYTILTFANVRVKRYEKELAEAKAALELAHASMMEATQDCRVNTFGQVELRKKEALRAMRKILKHH